MSAQSIDDYLTKQLLIEKNVVTYRSLSRQHGLHVNVAKNKLAEYYKHAVAREQAVAATYLLSGEARPPRSRYDDEMDVDDEEEPEEDVGGDLDVPKTKFVVAGEKDIEAAKSQFIQVHTIHVYSLSAAVVRDASLLCTSTDKVREIDNKKGPEFAAVVGKVVGTHVKTKRIKGSKASANVAGPSKSKPSVSTSVAPKVKEEEKPKASDKGKEPEKPKEKAKAQPIPEKTKDKPKATGKLDFSKAKPKPTKEEAAVVKKETEATKLPSKAGSTAKPVKKEEKARGVKRKSTALMLSDTDEACEGTSASNPPSKPPSTTGKSSNLRLRKNVLLSDDDESDAPPPPPRRMSKSKGKAKLVVNDEDSAADNDLRAMMDVDDDQVIRVSRDAPAASRQKTEEEEEEEEENPPIIKDEDVDMDDDIRAAPKKQRKAKKAVPLGSNGLKKKRVVKTTKRMDEKGFMVTEDHSSYESVDEEEPEPTPPAREKAKAKPSAKKTTEEAPAKPKPSGKSVDQKAPIKSRPSKGKQQSGISSFFVKK